MIKIELDKATKDEILKNHKQYVLLTAVQRLEKFIFDEQIKSDNKAKSQFKFWLELFGNNKESREETIVKYCTDSDMEKLILQYEEKFINRFGFESQKCMNEKQKKLVKRIKDTMDYIFNYRGFNRGKNIGDNEKKIWSRHKYVLSLGINVCPYCNRQYITSYFDDEEKTTSDIDHYYPKSKYPYLQMNIYNMIPSCTVCNSKTKLDRDLRHLNPYKDSSNSIIFEIPFKDTKDMYLLGEVEKILLNTNGNERAEASVEVFKLERIYQVHKKEVGQILQHMKDYQNFGNEYYKKVMGIDFKETIFDMWFDFLSKNPLDEPLVKMKQDIYAQLNRI